MKYGIVLPFEEIHTVLDLAIEAEQSGWDAFFVGDGIFSPDPWVTLAAIAARTERIRLGPLLTPVSRRRPSKLAAETATLDQLSRGRVILAVGLGALDTGFAAFGEVTDRKQRAQMLDEGLAIITQLWTGEKVEYAGEYFAVTQTQRAHPPCVQQPRIPIWVVGAWPFEASINRALRWDGWITAKKQAGPELVQLSPDEIRAMVAYTREHRASDAPFDIVVEGVSANGDAAKAADDVRPYAEAGATWWIESLWECGHIDGYLRQRIEQGPPRV